MSGPDGSVFLDRTDPERFFKVIASEAFYPNDDRRDCESWHDEPEKPNADSGIEDAVLKKRVRDRGMVVEKVAFLLFESAPIVFRLDYARAIGIADDIDDDPEKAGFFGQAEDLHERGHDLRKEVYHLEFLQKALDDHYDQHEEAYLHNRPETGQPPVSQHAEEAMFPCGQADREDDLSQ